MSHSFLAARRLTLALALVAGAGGCDKVTQSSFDQLQSGMTERSVDDLLGSGRQNTELGRGTQFPTNVTGIDQKSVQYGSDSRCIVVLYEDGKLKDKMKRGF